jgi:hypothetical protein
MSRWPLLICFIGKFITFHAKRLKGTTTRRVFQHFPEIKKHFWGSALWSRSYYVGSIGDMSAESVDASTLNQDKSSATCTVYSLSSSDSLGCGPASFSTSNCL